MTLPIEFYYTNQNEGLTYTYDPQVDIDFDRMIKGQAYWITPSFLSTAKPKTLIITDWRAPSWTYQQTQDSVKITNQLLEEHFELYLWQDGAFFAITLNNNLLEHEYFRNQITPISADKALKKASRQLKLPADRIHILDDYWMNWLKTRDPVLPNRYLSVVDYALMQSNYPYRKTQILKIIQQAKPTLNEIILNELSIDTLKVFNDMQEMFPHLPCNYHIDGLNITYSHMDDLLSNGVIKQNYIEFFLNNLNNIKECSLKGSNLMRYQEKAYQFIQSHYNVLSLTDFPNLPANYIQGIDFHALEVLKIMNTKLERNDICYLLKSPKLKRFVFQPTEQDSDTYLTEHLPLSTMNALRLFNTTLKTNELHWFLSHRLKELVLYHVTLADINFSESLNFSSLLTLTMANSDLSSSNLTHILNTSINLISLNLQNLKQPLLEQFPAFYLPYLKQCVIDKIKISAENIHALLSSSQSLGLVKISMVADGCIPIFQGISLHHLKILEVTTGLSAVDIDYILQNSPELTKLNLSGNKNLHIPFSDTLNCSKLKELWLNYSSINIQNLEKILLQTPKLRTLNLSSCKSLHEKFNHSLKLKSLERLLIHGADLNFYSFMQIIESSSRLKRLNIFNHSYKGLQERLFFGHLMFPDLNDLLISGNNQVSLALAHTLFKTSSQLSCFKAPGLLPIFIQHIKGKVFPAMNTLYIPDNTLSHQDMINLLRAMPNLKYVNLGGCNQLNHHDPELKALLDCIEEVVGVDQEKKRAAEEEPSQPAPNLIKKIPRHNLDKFLSIKSTPSHFNFQFTGKNKTKNQKMIIEKLSQYLTLNKQDQPLIPRIQDGICRALSQLFIDFSEEQWNHFIDNISNWNGRYSTLDDFSNSSFNQLLQYVKNWQINPKIPSLKTYLGDVFFDALESLPMPCIISNPWHAVALKKTAAGWHFYDPNQEDGVIICTKDTLLSTINIRLGRHISIIDAHLSLKPTIKNPSEFIATGGVLSLCSSINKHDILTQLTSVIDPHALHGLLLRDVCGIPAWIKALKVPEIAKYMAELLQQYQDNHANFTAKLIESIADIPATDYLDALNGLNNILSQNLINTIQEVFLSATENSNHFDSRFETWIKEKTISDSPKEYCKTIILSPIKKQLIEISHHTEVFDLHYLLEQQAIESSMPIFYIDSPADLICSAPFIKRQADSGILLEGPGGDLYNFLNQYRDSHTKAVILINYTSFKSEDIVKFNSMLDDGFCVDGTPIPNNTRIIGLINPNDPDNYRGEDFYSRFDRVSCCPFKDSMLAECIPPLLFLAEKAQGCEAIELFNALDWKERLMGRWKIKKDALYFEEGALQKALEQDKPLHIQNGPWENPHFCAFWRIAQLRGYIDYASQRIGVPASLQLSRQQGYDKQYLSANTACYEGLSDTPHSFNPSLFGLFFTRYYCDNRSKTLETRAGILADYANQDLHLNVTRSIDSQKWAVFLHECQQKNIKLHCHFAPKVDIPELLQSISLELDHLIFKIPPSANMAIFSTNDVDASLQKLVPDTFGWMIIDASECKPAHLLKSLSGNLNKENLSFEFHEKDSWLEAELENNKKIILTGQISAELADHLAPILLARQQAIYPRGYLKILTDIHHPFNYLDVTTHEISREDKYQILRQCFTTQELDALSDEHWNQEPLVRLKVILQQRQRYPHLPVDSAWEGMESLSKKMSFMPFDIDNSELIAREFMQNRLNKVNIVLNNSPFVCLTGLTAVGKTTFVQTVLHREGISHLYQGEQQFRTWAGDKSAKQKLLFIDEANMANRNWSEFEGMFHNPPTIRIGGDYFPLDLNHKVVFASNPVTYGNGRCLPTLFQRHGNAVLFDLMPMEYIYETQLKPIFQNTLLQEHTAALSKAIMPFYQFILECSEKELLISPRELQMIALLTLSQSNLSEDPQETIRFYARTVTRPLVPSHYLLAFDEQFPPAAKKAQVQALDFKSQGDFIDTAERADIKHLIEDFLRLHQFRQHQANNALQTYGGLGGLILEGEPGIGKTELVRDCLKNLNIPFCVMPVSMRLSDKIKLLLDAFDKGMIVVIDEINSSPMPERLLNDLLMGKNPEGKRPSKPGFMIIGTQNPVTMTGRHKPAVAMARRFLTLSVPDYNQADIELILINKGLRSETARKLTASYLKQKKLAERNEFKPAPTFRDLLRVADGILNMGRHLRTFSIWQKDGRSLPSQTEKKPAIMMDFST